MLDIFDESINSLELPWEEQIEVLSMPMEQRIFSRNMKDWANYERD